MGARRSTHAFGVILAARICASQPMIDCDELTSTRLDLMKEHKWCYMLAPKVRW